MTEIHEQLASAAREAARLAQGVERTQLADSTPCPGYDVRALAAHLMQEIVLHSWDLAVATRQTPRFSDEVWTTVLRWLEADKEAMPTDGWYAAPLRTTSSSPIDLAVARSGRDPGLL